MVSINRELIEEMIYTSPLSLLALKDPETINIVNEYLPYSTGFEIECNKQSCFSNERFTSIPTILNVNIDSGEQRFRIPNGINGFLCLYAICEQLALNSELNYGSGIHYHVDCTDCFGTIQKVALENKNWILKELDSWEYKGNYNKRSIGEGHQWIRFNSLNTLEFRLGEMSFDYSLLVKRIIHANNIVKRLKENININERIYSPIEKGDFINYFKVSSGSNNQIKLQKLEREYKELKEVKKPVESELDIIKRQIENRVVKITKK